MSRQAATILLYALAVLIWGLTWINMKWQMGEVAPAASLTYRYVAAGALLLVGAAMVGKTVLLDRRAHLWCALQGGAMFSINYWLTYLAAEHLTTGIIAVMFAGASAVTMLIAAAMTRTLPRGRALVGAVLGIVGIGLVFWPEVSEVAVDGPEIFSGMIVAVSVVMFSVGGVIGTRNIRAGQPRYATVGWAMLYGGLVMACLTMARGETFGWTWTPSYLWSLAWLTIMGSLVVFVLYFTIIERIGVEKASYATVLFPLVALGVSTVLEDYSWPTTALVGAPLALTGNAMVLASASAPGISSTR